VLFSFHKTTNKAMIQHFVFYLRNDQQNVWYTILSIIHKTNTLEHNVVSSSLLHN